MGFYEIIVKGEMAGYRESAFQGLKLEQQQNGTTRLSGSLKDQSAVYGIINILRDMGLEILRFEKRET